MSDRFTWEPGDIKIMRPIQCDQCKHLRDGVNWKCDAFPAGIPARILNNSFDHTQPYPGDNGIRFEPKEKGA